MISSTAGVSLDRLFECFTVEQLIVEELAVEKPFSKWGQKFIA